MINVADRFYLANIPKRHYLIVRMLRRELKGKYQGSIFGRAWAVITPITSLAVYALVFTVIFPSRWVGQADGPLGTIVNLFAGLATFNLAAESLNTAPSLILSRPLLVTRLNFPLEILSIVSVATALTQSAISIAVLILIQTLAFRGFSLHVLWLPFVWLPLLLLLLAASWCLSCIGAFFRDCSQVMNVCTSLLIFLSAVFYPISSLPASLKPILQLNPIAMAVEQTREVLINHANPSLSYIACGVITGLVACELSLRFFHVGREAFADVI